MEKRKVYLVQDKDDVKSIYVYLNLDELTEDFNGDLAMVVAWNPTHRVRVPAKVELVKL
jgi:hypothetical protein